MKPGKAWLKMMNKTSDKQSKLKSPPVVAVPAHYAASSNNANKSNRVIVEFCCGENSRIGRVDGYAAALGCTVYRITAKDDVTTPQGKSHLQNLLARLIFEFGAANILWWAFMPCAGGPLGFT